MSSTIIDMDDQQQEMWVKRNQRIESLKREYPEPKKGEEKKTMDLLLHRSATKPSVDDFINELQYFSSNNRLCLPAIINQVSPSGNSLLHVAASSGNDDVARLLAYHFPNLITAENFQGDTPLHLAAGDGKLSTLTILIDIARTNESIKKLLKLRNRKGNTPLHEAVINGRLDVTEYLLSIGHELAYCLNLDGADGEEGKSPLYVAAQIGNEGILAILLLAIAKDDNSLQKLKGKSPAHAAIEKRHLGILNRIADAKEELLRAKETGANNALHLAASLGYVEGVKFLIQKCSYCEIEKNKEGLCPIHVACKKGHVQVLEELLKQWPNPEEFLTEKGQNILHVAAEHGRHRVVKFIIGDSKLRNLLNERDNDGNTPLHLATKHGRSLAAYALARNKEVDKTIVSYENLTPYAEAVKQADLLEATMEKTTSIRKDESQDSNITNVHMESKDFRERDFYGVMMTFSVLYFHGRPKREAKEHWHIKGKPLSKDEIKSRTEFLLVAGAAFSGVCQVPGGSNAGKNYDSVLYHFYYLNAFFSLILSVWAAIILCYWVQLFDIKIATQALWLASILVGGSFYFMCLAFLIAVAIDAQKFLLISVATFVGGAIFACLFPLFSIAFLIPPSANKIVENFCSPYVYYCFFRGYFIFQDLHDWIFSFNNGQQHVKTNS